MRTLGLGLVGYGGFGHFCLDAFAGMPDLQIVAVADEDPQRRLEASRQGFETVAHAADLLVNPDVNIVHISTPPHTHARLAIAAANAGKHILCEKPLALSLAEGIEMLHAAQANDVRLLVNYVLRYNPLVDQLQNLLRQGIIGSLHHLSLENWATDEPLKPGHWFWDQSYSGGIWIEHGVHFFDLFRCLTGQDAWSVAATSQAQHDGRIDRVWGLVHYTSGVAASFHHAFTQPARIEQTTIRLACAHGYVALYGWIPTRLVVEALLDEPGLQAFRQWSGQDPEILERYRGDQTQGWAFGTPYQADARVRLELELPEGKLEVYRRLIRAAMSDLILSIRQPGYSPLVTIQDALASLAVAQAATQAAKSEKWEPVPNPPGSQE